MAGTSTEARCCPRCGYLLEPSNDDLDLAIKRPWHIRNRQAVREYVASLGDEAHEWLLALFVDQHLNLLAVDTIARGGVAGLTFNTNAIVCRGLGLGAQGFLLVHNHPSGDVLPSETDVRTTARLRWLSKELELPLLEHFIVTADTMTTVGGL